MVHIKKIEIFGFKSFGFRNTIVEFEQGMVAITGANGSGKSNILDAIVFAMGENRPRMMRVDKLSSLLHDGSKRGHRMARASLHLDNSDRGIPEDSDTVEITREMAEGGENTYYLNKKKTTRTQVGNMLDVVNAGLNQLNAVQQGTVTRIAEFSPEEKRRSIEDMIGLVAFDEKKAAAQKELDIANQKLGVEHAKMGEQKKWLEGLELQRNTKMRHDMLESEISRLRAIDAFKAAEKNKEERKWVDAELERIGAGIKADDAKKKELESEIADLEEQKRTLMRDEAETDRRRKGVEDSIVNAIRDQSEIDNEIKRSKKRMRDIDAMLPGKRKEVAELGEKYASMRKECEDAKVGLDASVSDIKRIEGEIGTAREEKARLVESRDAIAKRRQELETEKNELHESLANAKASHSKETESSGETEAAIKSNTERYEKTIADIGVVKKSIAKLDEINSGMRENVRRLRASADGLDARGSKYREECAELESILAKTRKAAEGYNTKMRLVQSVMHEDYTIARLKENSGRLGIRGIAYEMLSWEKKYERAVLAASSDWLKAVIVDDFATLLGLAETARARGLPRLKIIPLDALPKKGTPAPRLEGTMGSLADFVKAARGCESLTGFMFGNVWLAGSRDAARRLAEHGHRAVSLEGELFEPDSAATIDINSRISRVSRIISMSTSVKGLYRSISLLEGYVRKKRKAGMAARNEAAQKRTEAAALEKRLAAGLQAREDHWSRLRQTEEIGQNLMNRIEVQKENLGRMKGEAAGLVSKIESLESDLAAAAGGPERDPGANHDRIKELEERLDDLNDAKHASLDAKHKRSTALTRANADATGVEADAARLRDFVAALESEKRELEKRIPEKEKELQDAESTMRILRDEESSVLGAGSTFGRITELDEELKSLRGKEKAAIESSKNAEIKRTKLRNRQELLDTRYEEHGRILAGRVFAGEETEFETGPLLAALEAEVRAAGTINAGAPELYESTIDGYHHISTKKNELERESNAIIKFIEDTEKEKKQIFLDAFDRVNDEIRGVFNQMTGGQAWIELEDEDEIFESGISYMIQFPNKPKRGSAQISGGEKTLAAIVFVLALQRLKPSPFYLFDEVDAHLDGPNSQILADVLERRAKESQFIMVSLKDSVVAKSQLIYGVYPDGGSSNVVVYKKNRVPVIKS